MNDNVDLPLQQTNQHFRSENQLKNNHRENVHWYWEKNVFGNVITFPRTLDSCLQVRCVRIASPPPKTTDSHMPAVNVSERNPVWEFAWLSLSHDWRYAEKKKNSTLTTVRLNGGTVHSSHCSPSPPLPTYPSPTYPSSHVRLTSGQEVGACRSRIAEIDSICSSMRDSFKNLSTILYFKR